ncbi:hypothetical protein [Falsiroseomonas sp. CW058]|uniref:hypothetical protein n=1 Tax=Falsiroseomonas sp. CW058 TaxID=3388664 RepID=UPI003D316B49
MIRSPHIAPARGASEERLARLNASLTFTDAARDMLRSDTAFVAGVSTTRPLIARLDSGAEIEIPAGSALHLYCVDWDRESGSAVLHVEMPHSPGVISIVADEAADADGMLPLVVDVAVDPD